MNQFKSNDMMLQVSMRVISLIIFVFSCYLFFAGHNAPGGGFIVGLMTASAILVLYLVFVMKTITKAIPFNFTTIIGVGLLLAVITGISRMIFVYLFL